MEMTPRHHVETPAERGERLIRTWGHSPACNNAGNPPGCTCVEQIEAQLAVCVKALTDRIDAAVLKECYKPLSRKP
jgi:hypothetical protein